MLTEEQLIKELRERNIKAVELGRDINTLLTRINAVLEGVKQINSKLQQEREITDDYRNELTTKG